MPKKLGSHIAPAKRSEKDPNKKVVTIDTLSTNTTKVVPDTVRTDILGNEIVVKTVSQKDKMAGVYEKANTVKLLGRANILISHAFLRTSPLERDAMLAVAPYTNMLIDSGAYTNFQIALGKLKGTKPINFESYMSDCTKYYSQCWNYIAFDVVRNNQATRDNYETMLDRGLDPIPVLTPTESVDYAMELVGKSSHHRICISGSATGSVGKLWERIQKVHKLTQGKALIHGLGLMRYPTIFQLPLATVDASTMTTGSRFGTISFYDRLEGVKIIHWSDLTAKAKEQWMWKLLEYGIDIDSLKEFGNYRTAAGIPSLVTMYAYLKFLEHCTEKNLGLFFAIPNSSWLIITAATYYTVSQNGGKLNYKLGQETVMQLRELKKTQPEKFYQMMGDIFRTGTSYQTNPLTVEQDITKRFPIK